MDADGTDVVLVTDDAAPDTKPVWSPDGAKLVWERNIAGQSRIVVAAVDGDPCAAGPNRFGLELGALALLTVTRPAGSLAAGGTLEWPLALTMPCSGSAASGETLGFEVVVTATS